jgi:hypothetical protein
VAEEAGTTDFEDWYSAMDVSDDVRSRYRPWFLQLFRDHGQVTKDVARVAYRLDQLAAAEIAVGTVVEDLHRTTGLRPQVRVDDIDGIVRITVGGGYTTPSVDALPTDERETLLQVAGYVQHEFMSSRMLVWPTCPVHDFGLHPELLDGLAVWRCRPGGHTVGKIGELLAE